MGSKNTTGKKDKNRREINEFSFLFSQNLTKCLGQDLEVGIHEGNLKSEGVSVYDEIIKYTSQQPCQNGWRYIIRLCSISRLPKMFQGLMLCVQFLNFYHQCNIKKGNLFVQLLIAILLVVSILQNQFEANLWLNLIF